MCDYTKMNCTIQVVEKPRMKQKRVEGVRWRDLAIAFESESSPHRLIPNDLDSTATEADTPTILVSFYNLGFSTSSRLQSSVTKDPKRERSNVYLQLNTLHSAILSTLNHTIEHSCDARLVHTD